MYVLEKNGRNQIHLRSNDHLSIKETIPTGRHLQAVEEHMSCDVLENSYDIFFTNFF